MIDTLIEKYRVDERLIFVAGWSNGGMMGYRLACELSDKIAGAALFAPEFSYKKTTKDKCIGEKI